MIVNCIHVNNLRVDVVFYSAIFDGVLRALIAGGILFGISYFSPLGNFEKLQLIVVWLITGYAFAISVLTVLDRSLSFCILEKLSAAWRWDSEGCI